MSAEFKPTEATKAKLASLDNVMSLAAIDEFFALWITEKDARKAGSIMAHRYLTAGAKFAVFGAMCQGHEPSRDLWIAACNANFDDAVSAVTAVLAETEAEEADAARPDGTE